MGLSSGFMLGLEVKGQEVNGDLDTADVLYNISEECINWWRLNLGAQAEAFSCFPRVTKGLGLLGTGHLPVSAACLLP